MTRKHFIALADILRNHHKRGVGRRLLSPFGSVWAYSNSHSVATRESATFEWNQLTEDIADLCAEQNPRFDRKKWLAYLNQ
jgi:hypothetical protein